MHLPKNSHAETPPGKETGGDFGAIVKQLRTDRGLTLAEVASRIKVTVSYISLLENGRRRPSSKLVAMFKEALALSPEEEARLLTASGYAEDALTRGVKFLASVIESETPADEIDHALMIDDLVALASGWRELLYGKFALLNGDFDRAAEHFDPLAESSDLTPTLAATSAIASGDVYEKKGELETAENQVRRAQELLRPLTSKRAEFLSSEATAVGGMVLLRKGEYEASRKLFDAAKESYVVLEGSGTEELQRATLVGLTRSYNRLALLSLLSGESGAALSFCEKAESYLARVNTDPNDRRRLRLVALRAWANMQQDNFTEARKLHTRALEGYSALHDPYGVAKNRLYLGDDYRAEIEAGLKEDTLIEDGTVIAPDLRRVTLAERLKPLAALLADAEYCYRDAIGRLETLGVYNLLSRAYRSLGDILRFRALLENSSDLHNESARYLRQALYLENTGSLRRRLPTTYASLARLEWDAGSLAAAANYFGSARGILADPNLEAQDTSGKRLRFRYTRARDLLLRQLGEDKDEAVPEPWRQARQRLLDTLVEALLHGKYQPVATSTVHRDWTQTLATVEHEPGPRYLAQNLLSTSLSSAMPAGAQGDTATIYKERREAFLHGAYATPGRRGREPYRDICSITAVQRALNNPATEELCRNQISGALDLLREQSANYSLFLSAYELPYGLLIKGGHVLIEVSAKLANRFGLYPMEGMTKSSVLCYHIKDNPALADNLIALFGELAKLCEQDEDTVAARLESLKTESPQALQEVSAM